jgi:hypothetical protein
LPVSACPVCRRGWLRFVVSEPAVAREVDHRYDFVHSRVGHRASPTELKDLTDFMHGFPAPLAACSACGVLVRAEEQPRSADHYEEDPNDPALMDHVYPRYVQAFRQKQAVYRDLLPPNSDVLELGSHLGGFLQTAEEWNWRPLGLDVGLDTSAFARRNGFTVRRKMLEDADVRDRSLDGVFIWNCFEQIAAPVPTLLRAWTLLRDSGVLVVRVPNALFYRVFGQRLCIDCSDQFAMRALAYNNLLGFPYLYGYTAESLNRLVESCGFKYLHGANSELVTMPFPDISRRIECEQRAASSLVAEWSTATTGSAGTLTGPWIELVYRKLSESAWRKRAGCRAHSRRLPRQRIDLRFLERAS